MGAAGILVKAGYSDCATWITAHAAAGTVIPIVNETLTKQFDLNRSEALTGSAGEKEFFLGTDIIAGDLTWELDYDNHGLFAYAFGSLGGGIYDLADEITDWFHLTIDKVTERWYFAACAINALTISGEIGSQKPVRCTASLICRSASRAATAFPAISETPARVFAEHLLGGAYGVRLADQVDALSSSTDNLGIKNFEFKLENNLKGDDKDSSGGGHVLQPIRQAPRKVTMRYGLARYSQPGATYVNPTTLATWKETPTRLQSDLLLSGSGGTMTLQIPEAKIVEGANWSIGGPGPIEDSIVLECFDNLHNTPMSAVTKQARLTTT